MANDTKVSLAYTISLLDSPIQNTTLGVVAISIALATLVVAYLQYKRSASREHPTVAVEQERPIPPSNDELPFDEIWPNTAASNESALPPATFDH